MKSPRFTVTVTPNRERGYDATVIESLPRWMLDAECSPVAHTVNAPSEAAARAHAQAWIDAQPARKRVARSRPLSEGALESAEAARNERDYQ